MQAIAAYLILLLIVIAAVFSAIWAGVLSIALYVGTTWIRSYLSSRMGDRESGRHASALPSYAGRGN